VGLTFAGQSAADTSSKDTGRDGMRKLESDHWIRMTFLRIVIPLYLFVWAWSYRKTGTHFSGSCSDGRHCRIAGQPV